MRIFLAAALALAPVPTLAQTAPDVVTPVLAEAGPGTRWGVVVADAEGREIVALNPEARFMPASNTKLYTTAAALWAEARGEGRLTEARNCPARGSDGFCRRATECRPRPLVATASPVPSAWGEYAQVRA